MRALIDAAYNLAVCIVPSCVWTEDDRPDGHWSGTKDEMERFLQRKLTQAEVTVLSLSRNFGPVPYLLAWEDVDIQALWFMLWPEGNDRGNWLEWDKVACVLEEFDQLEIVQRECVCGSGMPVMKCTNRDWPSYCG